MTQRSVSTSDRAYVWVWLPETSEPIPMGVLVHRAGTGLSFSYGERYLARPDKQSLYGPTLPLSSGWFEPLGDLGMPGAIRDGAPDGWGRRVILNRLTGARGRDADVGDIDELTCLLQSGSNRFGAFDFQASPDEYVSRTEIASLDMLQEAAQLVEAGESLPAGLSDALLGGSTIGGARPKALIDDGDEQWIAKFSTSSDNYSVVGAEAASIELARLTGIEVPDSKILPSLGREVLLTRRFDRPGAGRRRMVVSALTMLKLDETEARYGTYPQLVDVFREVGSSPRKAARDLFERIAFNIAISNTDDHLRNHAAFWDGSALELTPAYDLSPMNRSGETATQAIAYGRSGERQSNFFELLKTCHEYGLASPAARGIIDGVISSVRDGWDDAADVARLTAVDRRFLWGRQFLNPGAFFGY